MPGRHAPRRAPRSPIPVRHRPRGALAALALAAALIAGACSATTSPSSSVAPATATAAASPTLATTLPSDLCAGTGVDCALQPGTYLAQAFQPPIGFSLADDGWINEAYVERAIQLVRGPGDDPTQSVSIVSGQLDGPKAESAAAGATAAAFLTYLRTVPGITVGPKSAVLVGGLPASQLDVHVGSANVTLFQTPIAAGTDDTFDLRASETARLIVEDVGTARVVFIIETFRTTKLDTFFSTDVQPFLASVTYPTP